jgi:hypothetical protein
MVAPSDKTIGQPNSSRLDCVKEPNEALSHFQAHTKALQMIRALSEELMSGEPLGVPGVGLKHLIKNLLDWGISSLRISATADSTRRHEQTFLGATYLQHDFFADVDLVRATKDHVVLSCAANVSVEIVGEYEFKEIDRIDRVPVTVEKQKVAAQTEFIAELLSPLRRSSWKSSACAPLATM